LGRGAEDVPRYEYRCKKCNKSFDVIHGINDKVDECKFCGSEVRRVFHPVGIVFKGSGFYATDSRNSSRKMLQPPPGEKETPSSSASEGNGKESQADKKDSKKDKKETGAKTAS